MEYQAGNKATNESVCTSAILDRLGETISSFMLLVDNHDTNAIALDPEYYACTQHIHGHQRYITRMIKHTKIVIVYIPIQDMIANILTKSLLYELYCKFKEPIGLQVGLTTDTSC